MANEKFCLRWNDFETNISTAFRDLREDKDFFDVTLVCDQEQIQAHKVILSACSPFFRKILHQSTHPHPLIYLRGVQFMDIQSVLNFMYHGEVNVAQEELNTFLSVAEDLKVKGLTQQNHGESQASNTVRAPKSQSVVNAKTLAIKPRDPPVARPKPSPAISSLPGEEDDIVEFIPVKAEPRDPLPTLPDPIYTQPSPPPPHSDQLQTALVYQDVETYEDYGQYAEHRYQGLEETDSNKDLLALLDAQIEAMMFRTDDKIWHCVQCDKRSIGKTDITRHIEATHLENHPGFPCDLCGEIVKTRNALRQHKASRHKFV